jgi:Mlc titration factor MtfA (ptsG expression regulator)
MLFLVLLASFLILAAIFGRLYLRYLRRKRLMAMPFPSEWKKILERNVPLYMHIPPTLKRQLHGHIHVLLAEKHFEGCGGLEMTDEIKVTIAAQACILLLNRKTNYYPRLHSILVYPSTFVANDITYLGNQAYIEGQAAHLGESWRAGIVILAWDNVMRGAIDLNDGQNIVLHEFAHQLDQEDGAANGAPVLERSSTYIPWARILGKEYEKLQREVRRGLETVMDEYGTENPAEFFAVATEAFFEKPYEMKVKHPELYEALKTYYRVDPLDWMEDVKGKK